MFIVIMLLYLRVFEVGCCMAWVNNVPGIQGIRPNIVEFTMITFTKHTLHYLQTGEFPTQKISNTIRARKSL